MVEEEMPMQVFALLIHDHSDALESLENRLKKMSVETCNVRTLVEAERMLPKTRPQLMFTDTSLPDGSWADVINLAERSGTPVDVIVVSTREDIELYISALERGAFDFVIPPFEQNALEYVVHAAIEDVNCRRHALIQNIAA